MVHISSCPELSTLVLTDRQTDRRQSVSKQLSMSTMDMYLSMKPSMYLLWSMGGNSETE